MLIPNRIKVFPFWPSLSPSILSWRKGKSSRSNIDYIFLPMDDGGLRVLIPGSEARIVSHDNDNDKCLILRNQLPPLAPWQMARSTLGWFENPRRHTSQDGSIFSTRKVNSIQQTAGSVNMCSPQASPATAAAAPSRITPKFD